MSEAKSHILVSFSGGFRGGAENVLLDSVRMFKEAGMPTKVCLNSPKSLGPSQEILDRLQGLAIEEPFLISCSEYLSFSSLLSYLYNLARIVFYLLFKRPRLVLVEGKYSTQLFAPACKLLRLPLISWVHFPPGTWELNRCLYALSDKVLLCSSSLKPYFENSRVSLDKLSVIRNYVDSERFSPAIDQKERQVFRQQFRLSEGDFVISLVGHLSKVKAQAEAIRALSLLMRSKEPLAKNPKLLLAGADNSEEQSNFESLKRLVEELGLQENVLFLGKIKEVDALYKASDIMILPSFREGLPLSILEAMSSGLPVIASDVDGNSEAVRPDETGVLVEPGNIDSLASALQEMLSSSELRESLGASARQVILGEFSETRFREDLFREVKAFG